VAIAASTAVPGAPNAAGSGGLRVRPLGHEVVAAAHVHRPVGDFGDGFGSAVAVSGSTIVALNTPTGVNDGDMAYIYARPGSTRSDRRDAYTA
jgi:hypothetical protein